MKIRFQHPFLSIQAFPDVVLPSFTLVTGVNGSGKTHLLRAIERRSLWTEANADSDKEVVYLDWTTLVPNEGESVEVSSLYGARDKLMWSFARAKEQELHKVRDVAHGLGIPAGRCWDAFALTSAQLAERVPADDAERIGSALDRIASTIFANTAASGAAEREAATPLWERYKRQFVLLGRDDFEVFDGAKGPVGLFEQNFVRVFLEYFERQKLNAFRRLDSLDGASGAIPPLSSVDFAKQYGPAPWDLVNKLFVDAGIDFEIDHPHGYTTTNYQPRLTKRSSGALVSFKALSSGEKVLISLALCVFRAGLRGALQKPRLLLLDEIDAPLHPSMARTLIDIVSNTIVGDHGIQVLMTTHSPSTVAMAPDESIYAMEPGKPGLYKVGKRQAISLLTSAIPTLSIAFDGRRQVLVESVRDAGRYEALYLQVAARLKPDRSLTFIGVGRKPESGADENAGCAKVKEMVGSLSGGGNESVLGLIDWDTTNAPSDRIFVLAHGVRYSIENVLLDPLLVAAAAVRKKRDEGVGLGFTQEEAFGALASMNEQRLQAVADAVQRLVLNVGNGDALPNLVDCQYQGGRNVKVSRDYLQMKGHKLQERVVEALPCLRAFHKEDELLMHIADSILVDLPGLCPVEIEAAFARMLEWRPT